MLLTIAIPAHNKSHLLRQAIVSIVKELEFGLNVDLIVSDNSLNNDVENLITKEFKENSNIKLFNSKEYKCLDSNVNRSVELASGEYVWIFGDDDLIVPGVLSDIVTFLKKNRPSIVVLNSKSFKGNKIIEESRLPKGMQTIYEVDEDDKFLANMAGYLTYVGGILVNKKIWLDHYDKSKIGSFFAHIVCIAAIKKKYVAHYFSNPAIKMRLGFQTWTNNSFLIWYKLYPEIIWGLKKYSDKAKNDVINPNPMSSMKTMIASKSYGRLNYYSFKKFVLPDNNISSKNKFFIFLISIIPVKPFRLIYIFFILIFKKKHTIKFSPNLALAQLRD